jgi:hypothetical protein
MTSQSFKVIDLNDKLEEAQSRADGFQLNSQKLRESKKQLDEVSLVFQYLRRS